LKSDEFMDEDRKVTKTMNTDEDELLEQDIGMKENVRSESSD